MMQEKKMLENVYHYYLYFIFYVDTYQNNNMEALKNAIIKVAMEVQNGLLPSTPVVLFIDDDENNLIFH